MSSEVITLARHAMATRFELALHGDDPVRLRAAGEEALGEVDRLEAHLSLFRPSSEIAHVNARAATEPVRVTPEVFALLDRAQKLSLETGGAFDITVAPLMRMWGFIGGSGRVPSVQELEKIRTRVGMHLVELNAAERSVRFARSGVMLDLGAIGKGYAIERAVEILREAGIESALLHGGTSTVYALGTPPDAEAWRVGLPSPADPDLTRTGETSSGRILSGQVSAECSGMASEIPAAILLRDEALSISAAWGRYFHSPQPEHEVPQVVSHVLDPHSGRPAQDHRMAVAVLPWATETDALSTALLVGGSAMLAQIARIHPSFRGLVVIGHGSPFRVEAHGIRLSSGPAAARVRRPEGQQDSLQQEERE